MKIKKYYIIIGGISIIIILSIFFIVYLLMGFIKTERPSSFSKIYIEKIYEHNGIKPKKIEIINENDIEYLFKLFSKRYIAYNDGIPACPFDIKISFIFNDKIIYFLPATDDCERIMYNDTKKVFEIKKYEKELLSELLQKYGFL